MEEQTIDSSEPETSRPRMYGGHLEPARLPWKWAVAQLEVARNYWIATTRPNGQPHCRPVWGVWLDNVLYQNWAREGPCLQA